MPSKRNIQRRMDSLGSDECEHATIGEIWKNALLGPADPRRTWSEEDLERDQVDREGCPHCPSTKIDRHLPMEESHASE